MTEWGSSAALAGLELEAVEWLPSGADSGLVRVRGRWTDAGRREAELPALGVRRGDEMRRFDSLPDARFGRDPAVWRGTYLVPAALMDPAPDELWLAWESGARAALPAPARGFEPPATPGSPPPPEPEGEVIDRAVLAERRARRAEAAERAQAQRAAEALKAVEVLELRSAELERRLEALHSEALPAERDAEPSPAPADAGAVPSAAPADPRAEPSAAPVEPAAEPSARAPLAQQPEAVPVEPAAAAPPDQAAVPIHPAAPPAVTPSSIGATTRDAAAGALAEAVAAVKRLRHELGEQRHRLRRSELLRAADAVALATLRGEEGRARRLQAELGARERELAQAIATAEASAEAARRAAAKLADARADLDAADRDLGEEREAHAATRERLADRERELAAIGQELEGVRAELATVRRAAEQRAAQLERRLTELGTALEAERQAHGVTATERETARAGLASAESVRSAESVARAALDEELDRERAATATLTAALDSARTELTAALTTQTDLVLSREQARAEAKELAAARDEAASAESSLRAELAAALDRAGAAEATAAKLGGELEAACRELAAARERTGELERELETRRGALDSAGREAGGLLARIAELERAADDDLARRAREQAAAASAVGSGEEAERRELEANLDAAAAALRARAADASAETATAATASESPSKPAVEAPAAPTPAAAATAAGAPTAAVTVADAPAAAPAPPAAPPRPPRPQIVTESRHPPRADMVGSSKRRYPWLRGALVKLAHDDPRAATRLVLGLVPVQRALVTPPLEYDLTIRGSGTYAISIGEQAAVARSVGGPRPRSEAAFHASADIVTIAELLAGVDKRMGRWIGSVKVHGRRSGAEALRTALARANLDLAAAARAGADLDPDLVFRAFAYAIHPSWTKGHAFTVAQELAGPRPMRWHVSVRDGKPVTVERRAPAQPPDAVVSMTREAFSHLLRGEPAPSGERPAIRGDRAVIALLKGWTDRAQGR